MNAVANHLRRPGSPWSAAEDAILRAIYPVGGASAVQLELPVRSINAIQGRWSKLTGALLSPASRAACHDQELVDPAVPPTIASLLNQLKQADDRCREANSVRLGIWRLIAIERNKNAIHMRPHKVA